MINQIKTEGTRCFHERCCAIGIGVYKIPKYIFIPAFDVQVPTRKVKQKYRAIKRRVTLLLLLYEFFENAFRFGFTQTFEFVFLYREKYGQLHIYTVRLQVSTIPIFLTVEENL